MLLIQTIFSEVILIGENYSIYKAIISSFEMFIRANWSSLTITDRFLTPLFFTELIGKLCLTN
jgi:hypothetical protein